MQRGAPVAARGGLPVPLLGLGSRGLPGRGAVQRARQPVGGLPVALLGGGAQPALRADVTAVLQQVREGVRPERVARLGGLAQPVLGGGLVPAFPVVSAQRVGRGRGARDGGDAPPAGRLVRVAPLVQQHAQVVGRGPVPSPVAARSQRSAPSRSPRRSSSAPSTLIDAASPLSAPLRWRASASASAVSSASTASWPSSACFCTNRPVSNRVALSPINTIVPLRATRAHPVYRSRLGHYSVLSTSRSAVSET